MVNVPNLYVYVRVISILVIIVFVMLNISSFIAYVQVNTDLKQNIFLYSLKNNIELEISLTVLLLAVNIAFYKYNVLEARKEKFREDMELDKYRKELEKQYQAMERITSLYNNTIKSTDEKKAFFYNMSHELKTPITVMLGAIQLIEQKGILKPDRRASSKYILTIRQNCYRLLRLVNNILDLSRIESGYVKFSRINCNIVYLVEEICQSVIPYAMQKSISLEFDTTEEEIIAAVDVDKIERIILNLLSNAIKYTKGGGEINIFVERQHNDVHIYVKDTGIGIPHDMQQSVFEPYHQVDNSLTRGIEGSGLGLSIVKSFVELHGGSIAVNSEPERGSEFHICMPIQKVEMLTSPNDFDYENSQMRIINSINIEFSAIYQNTA